MNTEHTDTDIWIDHAGVIAGYSDHEECLIRIDVSCDSSELQANKERIVKVWNEFDDQAATIQSLQAQVEELRKHLTACLADYEYIANLDVKHIPGICEWLIKRAKTCRAALSGGK